VKNRAETQKPGKCPGLNHWESAELSLRLTRLSTPEEVIVWAVCPFACSELSVPDPNRLTDQTTVRNSSQHMQFFDLFAGLSRDPADCPSIIHCPILFVVRHLYVFRAAWSKLATIGRARSRLGHTTSASGQRGVFQLSQVVMLCDSEPISRPDAVDVNFDGGEREELFRSRRRNREHSDRDRT
jgi:hypothetical protein